MEDVQYNRKIELNEWIIGARWFYMVAVFLIGIMGNSLIGVLNIKFSLVSFFILLLALIYINSYFYNVLTSIKKVQSIRKLKILGICQIGLELIMFSILLFVFEDKNSASMFFFLPIISSAMIFGTTGALIAAVIAGAMINLNAVVGYFIVSFTGYLPGRILSKAEIVSFYYLTISLIQTILTSNFYIVIALFSGYTSKLFLKREQKFIARTDNLMLQTESRELEMKKLDRTAQQLAKKDVLLTSINKELDKKIGELEMSEKSMLKAFADLKEARMKSEEESNKIVAMIANFIDPIIVIDKNNKLSMLNPVAKEIFGLIDSDVGKAISSENNYSMSNFKNIISREFEIKTSKNIKAENSSEEEVIIKNGDHDLTYKVLTEKIIDNKGDHLGIMKIFYNLTREKMIDKLKSEFISIAAHQLRTPLAAIKWVIKMILDGDLGQLNKEQQEMLFKGYQSNERIINLVNDMLNVSRIEEGRFGYSFSQSDIKEVLGIVMDALENQIKTKHIKFTAKIPQDTPQVYIDKQKMTLVLQNLLENAVKYTPDYGKIEISIESGSKLLKVSIKDNGVGIPAKDQTKLFSKFFRADNVVRMQTEGSGLGLFIVKNVIEKHHGDIICKSEEGKGTEFVITLPIN